MYSTAPYDRVRNSAEAEAATAAEAEVDADADAEAEVEVDGDGDAEAEAASEIFAAPFFCQGESRESHYEPHTTSHTLRACSTRAMQYAPRITDQAYICLFYFSFSTCQNKCTRSVQRANR